MYAPGVLSASGSTIAGTLLDDVVVGVDVGSVDVVAVVESVVLVGAVEVVAVDVVVDVVPGDPAGRQSYVKPSQSIVVVSRIGSYSAAPGRAQSHERFVRGSSQM